MPELNNPEKMSHKVVSNLLYYQVSHDNDDDNDDENDDDDQTNYFVSFAAIFLAVFFFVPWKMIYIMILLAMGNNHLSFKSILDDQSERF